MATATATAMTMMMATAMVMAKLPENKAAITSHQQQW